MTHVDDFAATSVSASRQRRVLERSTQPRRRPVRRVASVLIALGGFVISNSWGVAQTTMPPPPQARSFVLPFDRFDWDPVTDRLSLQPGVLPEGESGLPVIDPGDKTPEAALLHRLTARGDAAGLQGVLYDNRDRGHSVLPPRLFPQMTRLAYPPDMKARHIDYGLAGRVRFPAIVLGNSSTAITSKPGWRSQPRLAMTESGGPARAAADYAANAIYIYPEHHDHDAADLYPAAWPYMVVSQGSSGSDRPFLRVVGLILAAFRPDTRALLEREGLVAPTVQMVLRRAQVGVRSRADYMSGHAHPSAFSDRSLAPTAMMALANSLAPDTIPPMIRLSVASEDFSDRAGLAGLSERLFDTPSAIARLWRNQAWSRSMVISAAGTRDPNGRALRFNWILLRGDSTRVRITPLDDMGITARISVDWQDARRSPKSFASPKDPPMSSRVDIGVFAYNGAADAAPAFVSIDFPEHEVRRYQPGPDGMPRLAEVNYDARGRGAAFDPVLWWSAPWRDVFRYDPSGRVAGWTRVATEPTPAAVAATGDYDAEGRRAGLEIQYRRAAPESQNTPPDLSVEVVPLK